MTTELVQTFLSSQLEKDRANFISQNIFVKQNKTNKQTSSGNGHTGSRIASTEHVRTAVIGSVRVY